MDRARRVATLWNWLPAFRAVAEYESIHKAALVLHVSPSALSRTTKLLEEAVGASLFVRSPTGLALTVAGTELLKATRESMRRVDDALEACGANERRATTLVAASRGAVLSRLLAMSAAGVSEAGPRLRLVGAAEERIADELLRGILDLVLVEEHLVPALPEELEQVSVGALRFCLHTPTAHAKSRVREDKVVVIGAMEPPRGEVVAFVDSIEAAEILATEGGFLALLPTSLAARGFAPVDDASVDLPIVAVSRRTLGEHGASSIDALVAATRLVLDGAR